MHRNRYFGMIIKIVKRAIIDGRLREVGEIVSTNNPPTDSIIIKKSLPKSDTQKHKQTQEKDGRIKKKNKSRIKKKNKPKRVRV